MAIFHFSAKVISRANGSSAVASAAYRSAGRLHDERLDRAHDFTNKAGVVHSEVMLPDGAPERLGDRSTLWNEVEARELRKDAQLSREVEFAIPRELTQSQGIDLARDFVQAEFVKRGMIADLNVHWDIGADGLAKPHAHVMLTMREVNETGFGAKVRDWNCTELIDTWRERWASHVNERLASLDIDARIDHRSLADQGIDLEPQNKVGPAASRMVQHGLEAERITEHAEIARRNGDKIIANPNVALDAITHNQATFTKRDLAMFVHRHSDGKDQFDFAMSAVQSSPHLVALGQDGKGEDRFTSRAMIEVEARLERATEIMAARNLHDVSDRDKERALVSAEARGLALSGEQRDAFDHATSGKDLGVVIGYAGTGKSAMLGVAREAWEDAGYQVRGAALSGIAAENLEAGSGIASRTIASLEYGWAQGRDLLAVYVGGQLSNLHRKNVEAIALLFNKAPRTLQRFFESIKWNENQLRDRCQQIVAREHAHVAAIGCIDESGVAKSGDETTGAARQWNGNRGKIDNCCVGVHVSYSAPGFQCLLDSRLYLPEDWANDPARRKKLTSPTTSSSAPSRRSHGTRSIVRWPTAFASRPGRSTSSTRRSPGRSPRCFAVLGSS